MLTELPPPVFHLEHEDVDGSGELIAIVGRTCVTTPLTPAWTRLMQVLLGAQDRDPPFPEDIRGLRRYGQIAREYAKRARHSVPPRRKTMSRYMVRIQERFDAEWKALVPGHEAPLLFDRRAARGARLAFEIPPKHRRIRDFEPSAEDAR